jgi:avidin family protein
MNKVDRVPSCGGNGGFRFRWFYRNRNLCVRPSEGGIWRTIATAIGAIPTMDKFGRVDVTGTSVQISKFFGRTWAKKFLAFQCCLSRIPKKGVLDMSLEGNWYNELNSSMKLEVNGNVITGVYTNAAGQATGDFKLYGVIEPSPVDSNQVLAWVVTWVRLSDGKNFHSVTAWSGQYQSIDQQEVLTTEWLLTSETDPNDDWASTMVGHDVFTRTVPASGTITKRLKLSAWSHPKG